MSDVAILYAESGEYEDFRQRNCLVFLSPAAAEKEAERRNAILAEARKKWNGTWYGEDMDEALWEKRDNAQAKILKKLQRMDEFISGSDISDLTYKVEVIGLIQ